MLFTSQDVLQENSKYKNLLGNLYDYYSGLKQN
jgi:hypothetical protein